MNAFVKNCSLFVIQFQSYFPSQTDYVNLTHKKNMNDLLIVFYMFNKDGDDIKAVWKCFLSLEVMKHKILLIAVTCSIFMFHTISRTFDYINK